ncbi:MAG: aminotransferase class IV [Chthoniobacter sp.]|nr:aminotransferase class IV [Chthoniobacter sp.]
MIAPEPLRAWQWNGAAFDRCTSIPLTDRGFRYGMSVFESLRVEGGVGEFCEQHVARLTQACADREFAADDAALRAVPELFRAAARDGFARIYVSGGDGPPTAPATQPRVFVFIEDRAAPDAEDAWELTLHDETYHAPFGGLKTANYWFNADALARARRRGCDEALLFNDRAELVSACCANVFLVHGDRLSTPARGSGARAGVVREWVVARRKVEERRLRREDVLSADEIFLTNSWVGIQPVATLEGRPLGPRAVGPKLAAEFAARR